MIQINVDQVEPLADLSWDSVPSVRQDEPKDYKASFDAAVRLTDNTWLDHTRNTGY